jgi:trk system potassium uptake protein TrkA
MVAVHVIIVGCGRVGSELAVSLASASHEVVVVDKTAGAFRRLPDGWPGRTVVGLGFDRDTLAEAAVGDADALAAVTSGDNSNILTARVAREHYEVPNVVARIYDPRRAELYQRLGIPTVATVTWTVDQVVRRLFPERAVTEWTDPSGQILLVERALPRRWVGRSLDHLLTTDRLRLVSVRRSSGPSLARPGMIGQEGDLLYLAVQKEALDAVNEQFAEADPRTRRL